MPNANRASKGKRLSKAVPVLGIAGVSLSMAGGASAPLQETGKELFSSLGCVTCHRFDVQGRGPNLQGIYNKPVLLEDGRTVIADENYVRESIVNPTAKIVNGFKPVMPTFQGIVSEEQLNALVAYVKSLNQPPTGTAGLENQYRARREFLDQ